MEGDEEGQGNAVGIRRKCMSIHNSNKFSLACQPLFPSILY